MKKKGKRNLGDNRVVHLSLKTSVLLSTISDRIPGSPGTESSNGHYMHHTISRGYPHNQCSAVGWGNGRRRGVKEMDFYVGAILLIVP